MKFVGGYDFIDTRDGSGIENAVIAAKKVCFAILMPGALSFGLEDPLVKEQADGEMFAHADLGLPDLQQQLLDVTLDT